MARRMLNMGTKETVTASVSLLSSLFAHGDLFAAERSISMSMFWTYPPERYYDSWYDQAPPPQTDGDIKARLVDRLRENPHTKDDDIRVDVEQGVVVIGGDVSSGLVKRAAADDAWDTPGVVDVSNQLVVHGSG